MEDAMGPSQLRIDLSALLPRIMKPYGGFNKLNNKAEQTFTNTFYLKYYNNCPSMV